MSTQDLPAVQSALATTTYPPEVASVRAARRFVADVLSSSGLAPLADDAGLVVSELAANAVLHARSPFDVVVHRTGTGVRISVRDSSPSMPVLVAPSASAMSGRGLALVERLVARWGAGPSRGAGKSVWFEVDEEPAGEPVPDVAELSVAELLAAWSDEVDAGDDGPRELVVPPVPAGATTEVVLPGLVAADLLAAKERMDDVLRELQLVLLAQDGAGTAGVGDRGLEAARRLDEAARAFDDVRRQVRHQVSRAVAAGQERVAVVLRLPAGTAERATAYRDAVEAAEALAELDGALLSVSRSPAHHRAVRRAYLDEVIAATRG